MDRRRHARFALPPMYSPVEVTCPGVSTSEPLVGHAYDAGAGGLWFEVDDKLEVGDDIKLSVVIPGLRTPIEASASIVRVEGEDDLPPYRVGVEFQAFRTALDGLRYAQALSQRRPRAAA